MNERKKDIFDKIMALPGLRILEPFYIRNKEVLLYLLFGGLTTLVSLITFWLFHIVLGINELIANIISWIFAVSFAFFTNRIWVFNAPTETFEAFLKQLVSFFGGRLATLGAEELILYVFITRLGLNAMLIKLVAQIVIIVLNYVVSKIFVFRKGNIKVGRKNE